MTLNNSITVTLMAVIGKSYLPSWLHFVPGHLPEEERENKKLKYTYQYIQIFSI